jgi:hypothetical protein
MHITPPVFPACRLHPHFKQDITRRLRSIHINHDIPPVVQVDAGFRWNQSGCVIVLHNKRAPYGRILEVTPRQNRSLDPSSNLPEICSPAARSSAASVRFGDVSPVGQRRLGQKRTNPQGNDLDRVGLGAVPVCALVFRFKSVPEIGQGVAVPQACRLS